MQSQKGLTKRKHKVSASAPSCSDLGMLDGMPSTFMPSFLVRTSNACDQGRLCQRVVI